MWSRLLVAALIAATATGAKVNGPTSPSGKPIQLDYPVDRHQKNKAGRDGAGLCVFTSLGQAADWQHITPLVDMRDWMTKYPGGGYPSKVTEYIKKKCKDAGVEVPEYVQVENNDLDILRQACRNGWMPCITYGVSPTGRYGGKSIAHMVNLAHAEGDEFAVLDNNYPGTFEWMNAKEFSRSYAQGRGKGWAVIFYAPGPPPPPMN
jgi:hypothetical protein